MPRNGKPENLIPMNKRTEEEQRELARKGGKASGVARRRKRDLKSATRMILNLPVSEEVEKILRRNNVEEEDFTNLVAMILRMHSKAMTGDVNAARFLAEMSGETPAQKFAEKQYKDRKKMLESGIDDDGTVEIKITRAKSRTNNNDDSDCE